MAESWHKPDLRRSVNLAKLGQVGSYLGTEEKAAHQLARAIHFARSTDCSVSWAAQQEAQDFINAHGLAATLDRMFELEKAAAKLNPCEYGED